MYIVDKYTFKINNVVMYYHRGSTCDPYPYTSITDVKHSEFL